MKADDLILIIVDDHICEPRDMSEAHVSEGRQKSRPVNNGAGGE
jgi:hypothetical protein